MVLLDHYNLYRYRPGFFASADRFNFREAIEHVVIDVSHAHFWDITSVSALDKVVIKFRREGTEVEIRGISLIAQA
ncbi:STAS domain [Serratia fonticola]|nr:STAS domain [Serratia fonticola]